MADKSCNICGGSVFARGPSNRLSVRDQLPQCASCHSLERHRALWQFYERFRTAHDMSGWTCLQISDDRSVDPRWFGSHTVSVYGGANSLDIQNLAFPEGQFDCVICNHVLEHVEDDRRAMAELYRVASVRGFVQISVPDPVRLKVTEDWGYPRPEEHGHFRMYGPDIVEKLRSVIAGGTLVEVPVRDPVTEMEDMSFVLTRSGDIVQKFESLYPGARSTCGGGR